jgi:hypothetical protein
MLWPARSVMWSRFPLENAPIGDANATPHNHGRHITSQMLSSTSVMDRGIPTEEVLAEMRQADPPVSYLVGTPKGRLSKLEKALLSLPWQAVRQGVEVKLLPQEQELYVLAQSDARIHKERAMRRRKLKWTMGAS